MPKIIIDIMKETNKVHLETVGFDGPICQEESKFIKDALGRKHEDTLKPMQFTNEQGVKERHLKNFCG